MRALEHKLAGLKAAARRALSRVPRVGGGQPARLVIRLDVESLPAGALCGEAQGPELGLAEWQAVITSAVAWLGPVPVTFLIGRKGDHALLTALVRFAHRLECGTELVTDGTLMDLDRAEELLDAGLGRVRILVCGVSDELQQAMVGNSVAEATGAVVAFVDARADRGQHIDIEVATIWAGGVDAEIRAVMGWARQAGADGFRVIAPYRSTDMPADPELLDSLVGQGGFCRSPVATAEEIHAMVAHQDGKPGAPRKEGADGRLLSRCPVVGQRLEINSQGWAYACPFKTPVALVEGDLAQTVAKSAAHGAEVRGCDRACGHVELAPRSVWG